MKGALFESSMKAMSRPVGEMEDLHTKSITVKTRTNPKPDHGENRSESSLRSGITYSIEVISIRFSIILMLSCQHVAVI